MDLLSRIPNITAPCDLVQRSASYFSSSVVPSVTADRLSREIKSFIKSSHLPMPHTAATLLHSDCTPLSLFNSPYFTIRPFYLHEIMMSSALAPTFSTHLLSKILVSEKFGGHSSRSTILDFSLGFSPHALSLYIASMLGDASSTQAINAIVDKLTVILPSTSGSLGGLKHDLEALFISAIENKAKVVVIKGLDVFLSTFDFKCRPITLDFIRKTLLNFTKVTGISVVLVTSQDFPFNFSNIVFSFSRENSDLFKFSLFKSPFAINCSSFVYHNANSLLVDSGEIESLQVDDSLREEPQCQVFSLNDYFAMSFGLN
ncbi:hypothetical protein P9112_007561 [Eukaryota sp. TZLM1-RC]